MSLRVGLGASQADLDVQGEIDFDFFEESDCASVSDKFSSNSHPTIADSKASGDHCSYIPPYCGEANLTNETESKELYPSVSNVLESGSSLNFNKPLITVSCDDGAIQKTNIETIIPTPFNYKDNKCGKGSPCGSRRMKRIPSPRLKSKIFKDDNEISDDSSISSMSESDSDVSSISDDSFELNDGTDSMTDVTPMSSPFRGVSPLPGSSDGAEEKKLSPESTSKKEGVKFTDVIGGKECPKCETIDLHELLRAVKRLEMGQNINSVCQESHKSAPVLTKNAKCRKNLSFSNEEVRRIDNDNQNLLKKIIAQQNRVKSRSSSSSHIISSSAVNRHRQQRQIELENLALLKRLESTKPSREVSRFHLLRDYEQRSSGISSRSSSRSSKSCSTSQGSSCRTSAQSSGRCSAVSSKSSSTLRSCSLSANKP